jgi:hypothetical protein
MVNAICPRCKTLITAKSNIRLAFRFHLGEAHNTLSREEQDGIMNEAISLIWGIAKRKKHKYPKSPKPKVPRGTPEGLRLLLEGEHDYSHIEEVVTSCCAVHPNCKYEKECRQLYDTRCNKWYVGNGEAVSPTKKQSTESVVVIVPGDNGNRIEVLQAIENQLSRSLCT